MAHRAGLLREGAQENMEVTEMGRGRGRARLREPRCEGLLGSTGLSEDPGHSIGPWRPGQGFWFQGRGEAEFS